MTVRTLRASQQSAPAQGLAKVCAVEDGEALHVERGGRLLPVSAHLCGVPALEEGDLVLISEFEVGVIVCGRLRRRGEPRRDARQADVPRP